MTVHPFGATSSPAVCAFALQRAALDCLAFPEDVQDQVAHHFYVDNWMNSFASVDSAVTTSIRLINALDHAGFNLTQFASSHAEVLIALKANTDARKRINIGSNDNSIERALGLLWDFQKDMFQLTVEVPTDVRTKRELLQVCASIYDPLGFLAAVKLVPKRLFQQTCRMKLEWDELLEDSIVNQWRRWAEDASCLRELTIRRCIRPPKMMPVRIELHVF